MPSELLAALADDVSLEMWDPLHDEATIAQPPRRSLFSAKSSTTRNAGEAAILKRNAIQLLCSPTTTQHITTSTRTGSTRSTVSFASRSPSPSAIAHNKPNALGGSTQLVEQSLHDVRTRLHSIVVKGSQVDKLVERSNTCDPAFLASEEVFSAYQQLLANEEHRMKLTASRDQSCKDLLVECNTATSVGSGDMAMQVALTSSRTFRPAMAAVTVVLILRQFESAVRKDVIATELAERLEIAHECWQRHKATVDASCHRETTHHRRALHVAETAVTDLCHTHRVSIELLEQQHRQDLQDLTTLHDSGRAMITYWKDHVRNERQQFDDHRNRCQVVDAECHRRDMILLMREREAIDIIGLASRERTLIECHAMFAKRRDVFDTSSRENSEKAVPIGEEASSSPLSNTGVWNSPGRDIERQAREALSSVLSSEQQQNGRTAGWEVEVDSIVRRLHQRSASSASSPGSSSEEDAFFDSLHDVDDDGDDDGSLQSPLATSPQILPEHPITSVSLSVSSQRDKPDTNLLSTQPPTASSPLAPSTKAAKPLGKTAAGAHHTRAIATRPQLSPPKRKAIEPHPSNNSTSSASIPTRRLPIKTNDVQRAPSPARKKEGSAPRCERSLLPHPKTARSQYGASVTTLCAPSVPTTVRAHHDVKPLDGQSERSDNDDGFVFDVKKYVALANQQDARRRKSTSQLSTLEPSTHDHVVLPSVEATTLGRSSPNDANDSDETDTDVLPLWRADEVGEESLLVEVQQHIKRHRSKVSRLLRQTPETTSVHGWMLRCTGMTMTWQKKYFFLTRSGRLRYSQHARDPSSHSGKRSSSAMSDHSNRSISQQQEWGDSAGKSAAVRWATIIRAEDVFHVEDRVATAGGVRLPSDVSTGNCFYVDFAAHCGPRLTDVALKRMRFCCFSKRERVEWVSALRSAAAVARQLELDGRTEPSPLAKLLSATTQHNVKASEVESPSE